jgi:glycosyltransferase involved in cell wall biosynthesis
MNYYPLVSLCIPVYNGIEFLQPMLNSVMQNTYCNVEIIVSDDNSQDQSLEVIRASQLSNLKILTHRRFGLVQNWNYCITQARGNYIKFLMQDDSLEPDCITKMVAIAESDAEIGLVFCRRHLISQYPLNPKHFPENLHEGWTHLSFIQSGITLLQDSRLLNHPHNKIGEPTNVLLRKAVVDDIGYFDPSFKQYVDLEMWLRIMTRYKIAFIDESLTSFRVHPLQTTHFNNSQLQTRTEIYRVWLKLVNDPIYQVVPESTRKSIRLRIIQILCMDFLKSVLFGRWDCLKTISDLLQESFSRPV